MAILSVGMVMQRGSSDSKNVAITAKDTKLRAEFVQFKQSYVFLYVVLMLSDWVQGTNMYTLYQSYGVDIGTLFITGFFTSGLFSLWIGPLIDKYGRKKACILYAVGEVVINLLEHSNDFTVLMVGRVIGGLTTALLFTSFESWMVSSHREHGFREEWLAETFSTCSVGNGLVAIFAGLVSQLMADWLGEIGPFRLAIALSAFVGLYVGVFWEENYGSLSSPARGDEIAVSGGGIMAGIKEGVAAVRAQPEIALCGLTQATFQGAMFTFVFMWVPVMFSVSPDGSVPTGLVYASLMASIAIGGCILTYVQQRPNAPSEEAISIVIYAVAAAAMAVCVLFPSLYPTMIAFFVFEMCVGANDGVAGIIRSRYIPDAQMGGIMNLMRVPLNLLVVVGTKFESWYPASTCFIYCTLFQLVTLGMAIMLNRRSATATKAEQRGKKKA